MIDRARIDARFMRQALRAARGGDPSPNPHVGAVVVKDGVVLGVGFHARAGEAHAEVVALRAAGDAARGATVYVTFEPCNHIGRTPPCTDALIAAGVARVVVGCRDPHPHVPGATAKLEAAGIEVTHGVGREASERLVAGFAKHVHTGVPFVTVKAAITLDGRMSTASGDSKWITGERARRHVHRMRARADAVMVGVGTVLADDPELTVRHVTGPHPLRVVLDTALRTPVDAKVCDVGVAPTVIFHGPGADVGRRDALRARGVELVEIGLACGRVDAGAALAGLGRRDVVEVMLEGGPALIEAMMQRGLVDRVAAFVAPALVGDLAAPGLSPGKKALRMADAVRLHRVRIRRFDPDVLIEGDVGPLDREGRHGYACDQS